MQYEAVVYDWDGVAVNSVPDTHRGVCHIFKSCEKKPPSYLEFYRDYHAPFVDYYREHGIDLSSDEISILYEEGKAGVTGMSKVFNNFRILFRRLTELHIKQYIISANKEQNILPVLRNEKILHLFKGISTDRSEKVLALRDIVNSLGCQPKAVIF